MPDTIHARQGDTLDGLIWRERRLGAANLTAILAANPGLAGHGAVLPTGTPVTLPDTPAAPIVRDIIQLWDD
jgi:phage tail protein X